MATLASEVRSQRCRVARLTGGVQTPDDSLAPPTRARAIAFAKQPLALSKAEIRAYALQTVAVALMLTLSVVSLVVESMAATVAAITVSMLSGAVGLLSVVSLLNRYRRAMRPEHRPLVWRFVVALIGSWSLYPVLFVLGPGVGNVLTIATLAGLLAVLDILSKNVFVLWVWSASYWLRRSERQSAELLNLFAAEPSAFHAESRNVALARHMLHEEGIEMDEEGTLDQLPLPLARSSRPRDYRGARVVPAAIPASPPSLMSVPSSSISVSSRWIQSAMVKELNVTEDSV